MEVILFTTHCPKCRVLAMKLEEKKIKYETRTDVDEMIELGIMSAPMLKVNGKFFDFSAAMNWIKEQ